MDDLISRKAAKKVLCGMCRWEGTSNCEECEHPIDDIPSAQLEHNAGQWTDPADLICYKCSACGMYVNQGYWLNEPIFWDYCPNCGAKMECKE